MFGTKRWIPRRENSIAERSLDLLSDCDINTDVELFSSIDFQTLRRLRDLGRDCRIPPRIYDFKKLLSETDFPKLISTFFKALTTACNYPVDIEFTANFTPDGNFRFNLLQCRPLQTKGLGRSVALPDIPQKQVFFSSVGNFMGGNVRIPLEYVVFVKPKEYLELPEREKYGIARLIGALNQKLKGQNVLLVGPGRWGTTTPSLGVPVHFSELSGMAAICEVSYRQKGVMPELSFGSHFFQDIVESGIFYAAVFEGEGETMYQPECVVSQKNLLCDFLPEEVARMPIVHLTRTAGLTLYSDVVQQKLVCGGTSAPCR